MFLLPKTMIFYKMYIITNTTNIEQVKRDSVHNTYKCVQTYKIGLTACTDSNLLALALSNIFIMISFLVQYAA